MISFKSFPVKFDVEKKKNNNLFISKSYEDYIALKVKNIYEKYLIDLDYNKNVNVAFKLAKSHIISDLVSLFSLEYTFYKSKNKKIIPKYDDEKLEDYIKGNYLTTPCRKTIELSFNTFFLKEYLRFFYGIITKKKYTPKRFVKTEEVLCFIDPQIPKDKLGLPKNKLIITKYEFWFNGKLNFIQKKKINSEVFSASKRFINYFVKQLSIPEIECSRYKLNVHNLINEYLKKVCYLIVLFEKNSNLLTNEIIIGTSGIIWNKIIIWFANLLNKKIYVFDHGVGNGFAKHIMNQPLEFDQNINFVCLNKLQKNNIKKYVLTKDSGVNLILSKEKKKKFINKNKKPIKKILFIQTNYKNYQYAFDKNNEFYQVYFQKKLFRILESCAYEVIMKPHPVCNSKINSIFFRNRIESKIFEKIYLNYDLLIFDYCRSTTFASALSSNIPIICVDHKTIDIHKNIKRILSKRVSFLEFKFDVFNLPIINLKEVKNCINQSQKKTDLIIKENIF